MSRTICSNPSRPRIALSFALIGLAVSAAAFLTQSPNLEALFPNRIPVAASRVVAADSQSPAVARGDESKSAYFAEFTGVGADERDMVWSGAVAGAAIGELTVRLAHEGRDIDTASPTWPVEGVVVVSGEDPKRAFAADVRGTIDWRTKRVQLAGEVSVGYMRGAHFEQTADLIDHDLSGEMRFAPTSLASAR
jgi:hypothetical protein